MVANNSNKARVSKPSEEQKLKQREVQAVYSGQVPREGKPSYNCSLSKINSCHPMDT